MSRAEIDEVVQALTADTERGEQCAHGLLLVLMVAVLLMVVW